MRADDREMVELVDGAVTAGSDAHAVMSDRIRANSGADCPPGLVAWTADDSLSKVQAWVTARTGRPLGALPTWIRFYRMDVIRGALFVLHAPHPGDEANLVIVADHGMLSRPILRAVARWAFCLAALHRLVLRIPADAVELQDFARRAGFRHEGTARGAEPDGSSTALWAMLASECPWLPRTTSATPTGDTSPPSSLRVH